MRNQTPESFPVSAIALPCVACRTPAKGVVCYCGADVCLPCLLPHQKHCGYAIHGVFRCDQEFKKNEKGSYDRAR